MTRQWIRVTSGKGVGRVGFILREHGSATMIKFPDAPFPFDEVFKWEKTFVRLTEAECAVLELTRPVLSVPSGGSRSRQG
jgi:hypothetical protein